MNRCKRDDVPERIARPDDACETLDHFLRAATLVRIQLNEFLEHYELSEVRYSVLAALKAARAGLSQSELADRLMQSESNISTLVDRMQQEGLVDRSRSEADRRKRVLLLSPSGQCLLERVESGRRSWALRVLRGVPADRRTTLAILVQQLGMALHDESHEPPSLPSATRSRALPREDHHRPEYRADEDASRHTPHLALQQMLSTLGMNHQLAESEQ
jgi:DNA-binding MarR family transcriptional regulator